MIYARISDPEVRRQYESALANGNRIAGPAAEALLNGKLDEAAVHWLQTNFLKTELELGHCLRLPAEGPCDCDLVLNCPKFLTTTEYAPRLRARLETEKVLIQDARQRGWEREVERHQATTPPPGPRPAAVALRAAQNGGLPRGLDRRARVPASVSLVVSPYDLLPRRGICVNHHRCGTISSARRERPLARFGRGSALATQCIFSLPLCSLHH